MNTTKPTAAIAPVNILSGAFKANPFPFYSQLRAEAPIYRTTLRLYGTTWLVTRYDDVVALLKDERFSKDRRGVLTAEQEKRRSLPFVQIFYPLENNMLFADGMAHSRLRNLVHKAFTPRLVEQLRGQIEQVSETLIDKQQSKRRMDVMRDFANILPIAIISSILGIPAADQANFQRQTKAIFDLTSNPNLVAVLRVLPSLILLTRYLRRLVRLRRAQPQQDLISVLAQVEEQGDQLNEDELIGMLYLLLIAGHETTVNLIGSGMLALLEHRDQFDLLRTDPSHSRTAIEELLRYTSPVEQATQRYAREDLEFQGVAIKKGELVLGVLASANRDEKHFPNPDALDITRDPNRHLAFGQGIHYCLGAPLARLEGQIAFSTLLRRLPDMQLAQPASSLRWRSSFAVRGLEELPITF